MKRICIILDDNTLNHHHGVRKYVFSLGLLIADQAHTVDFLKYRDGHYYKILLDNEDLESNGYKQSIVYGKSRREILQKLKNKVAIDSTALSSFLVSNEICSSTYDACIFAGPWCYSRNKVLPSAKKFFCMAHDAIPNFYALARPFDLGLWSFAQEHIVAYIDFSEKFDGVLAISPASFKQCSRVLGSENKIFTMPTFVPSGYKMSAYNHKNTKSQIVLAAPFDLRKGLKSMPTLINQSGAKNVVIFGGVRCATSDVVDFFEKVEVDSIIWYTSIDYKDQMRVYQESSLLLFPSLNEGLGLPVLEASLCGTISIVSNIDPLNRLVDSDFILKDDESNHTAQLARAMKASKDSKFRSVLFNSSQERWAGRLVKNQILEILSC